LKKFGIQKNLVSCHVGKPLLLQLEKYFLHHIPKLHREALSRMMEVMENKNTRAFIKYSFSVQEGESLQEYESVNDYPEPYFPGNVQRISFQIRLGLPEIFQATLTFPRDGHPSVEISTTQKNAEEIALRVCDNIANLISPSTNKNWVVHHRLFKALFPLAIPAIFVALGYWRHLDLFELLASQGWVVILALLVNMTLIRAYPLVSFATRRRITLRKAGAWLLLIVSIALTYGYLGLLLVEIPS